MDVEDEAWVKIPEFPRYQVSSYGRVMNIRTEQLVKPQLTSHGVVYVPLYENEQGYGRSLKTLVAKAFVSGEDDIFDTPINLDGDKTNNRADNIMWRPRWFAVKYSRQFTDRSRADVGPVYDVVTGTKYTTIFDVATEFGLLFRDVYRSTYSSSPVFPTQQMFRIPSPIHVR